MKKTRIAYREIPTTSPKGRSQGFVAITLNAPSKNDKRGWACSYQIVFPNRKVDRTIYGADSLQALMLGLEGMQAEVVAAELSREVALDWQGSKFKIS